MNKRIFTSESVTEGHPDKVCDQISDAILDAVLAADPEAKVAIETMVKTGVVIIAGELNTHNYVDIQAVARETIQEIGYNGNGVGFNGHNCGIMLSITDQAEDINMGVVKENQGAGDQGMMFGYACNETPELMPMPIIYAHKLAYRLAEVRKSGILDYLWPDGKSQVSVEYVDGKPSRIDAIVLSNHHKPNVDQFTIRKDLINHVIVPICGDLVDEDTKIHVNPTGKFEIGGPVADCGLTGRKIIVDTYGGMGRHGGGAFSGKDPSKVDRSAAYMARYIAKNLVAAELCSECEVQLAYAIGIAEPVSVYVDTFGSGKLDNDTFETAIRSEFDLTPAGIIRSLDLKKPIYKKTAAYGHFGRESFRWEKCDRVDSLKKYLNK